MVVLWEEGFSYGLEQAGAVDPWVFDAGVDGVGVEYSVGYGPKQCGYFAEGGNGVNPYVFVSGV